MPVYLEKITSLEGQDKADLEKLYAEYLGDSDAAPQWLANQLAETGSQCYGGRFNGRLLGAFFLSEVSSSEMLLEHLCVRELTRRRGFARQLIQRLQQQLQPEGQLQVQASLELSPSSLRVTDMRAPEVLWQQCEFELQNDAWVWAPK